ncbi:MAG: MBL fold metallo-hydrolase [Betaproteobacteria bacterium]
MSPVVLTYDSTNYYLIRLADGWLMGDTGWAGTLPTLLHLLKRKDIDAREIRYLVITHFHPDHCGLAQDLKDCGATLVVHECQVPFTSEAQRFFKPHHNFRPIETAGNLVVTSPESRVVLAREGIAGEVIATPGHTADSVSLIIDARCAFTGDLPRAAMVDAVKTPEVQESWRRIRSFKVEKVYPAHGTAFSL